MAAVAKFVDTPHQRDIGYMKLDIDDDPSEDIKRYFPHVIEFITENRETNVLVHCVSGISRSGACVVAYVMKIKGMSYDEALEFVRTKRPMVHPNSGFQAQLRMYEAELRNA